MIKAAEGTVIEAMESMMIEIAETMTGIDMTTAEALAIIVKANTNRDPMSESWYRRHRDTINITNDCPA